MREPETLTTEIRRKQHRPRREKRVLLMFIGLVSGDKEKIDHEEFDCTACNVLNEKSWLTDWLS